MPWQFAWQELRTDFFEFDEGHGYDKSMPYMLGISVFGNSGYCQILASAGLICRVCSVATVMSSLQSQIHNIEVGLLK